MMDDYCMECGKPFPSVFVFTDDKGNERFVHERCSSPYIKRLLGRDMYDAILSGDSGDTADPAPA